MLIKLAEPYVVTIKGAQRSFTQWNLTFPKGGGSGSFPMEVSFPEHKLVLDKPQTYEIHSGGFLGEN